MALSIRVEPAVLRWVMENEGWTAGELAAASGLGAARVRRWASVGSDIAIGDIRKMARNFRRPMEVLFMGEAPETAVPAFRRAGGGRGPRRPSRGALDAVRAARYVQDCAAEILRAEGRRGGRGAEGSAAGRAPEQAAAGGAAGLGIAPPARPGRGAARDRRRCGYVRERIESMGVITMQAALPGEDRVSALALGGPRPAVVLASPRDRPRRRIFALAHGYAHVALGDAGVACAADEAWGAGRMRGAEAWCSRFAGAALMPGKEFLEALREEGGEEAGADPLRVAGALADRFCVGTTAALSRAAQLLRGGAAGAAYRRCCAREAPGSGGGGGRGGGGGVGGGRSRRAAPAPSAAACIARTGRLYARLALAAEESGRITTSRLLDYLEIKLGSLDELRARCGAGQARGGRPRAARPRGDF